MKKVIQTRILALFMMALVPLLSPAVNTITYNATYDFDSLTLGTDTLGGATYTTVNYDGLFNGGEPGKPSLPIDYIKFSVPYNATNFTVTATLQDNMISNLSSYLVYPCQPSRMMNDTTPIVITPPDNNVYNSNSYYPSQNAWVVDEGFLAGENHIVTVAVMPMSYKHRVMGNFTTNQLKKSQTVSITLSYNLSDTLAMYPIIRQNDKYRKVGQQLTQSIVVNPNNVALFAPNISIMDTLQIPFHAPTINSGLLSFPYLVITTSELSHSLRRLIALKRQKGYNVKLVTVDEIMADPYAQYGDVVNVNGHPTVTFTDSPGRIRQYLKLASYYYNSQYLLLAGTDVPYRNKKLDGLNTSTDLYYSDLNSNWSGDTIDKYPDLFVGRILAKSEKQISNYTDKLLRYELNPGKGDYSYLQRSLYTGAIGMYGYAADIQEYMSSICPESTLIRERYLEQYPKACDVLDSINSTQYGFWSTLNHGGPSRITTYGEGYSGAYDQLYRIWAVDTFKRAGSSWPDIEENNGLNNLLNKNFPMISYSISCRTMPYYVDGIYSEMPMNFGESFTTGKDYGGPAYLGNTNDGYIPPSINLEIAFAKRLHEQYYMLGEAEALSKTDFHSNYYNYYIPATHNLLGDPVLEIWSDTPHNYHSINITRRDNSITIAGINADSTIVAYYGNDGQIGTDTISSINIIINDISPNASIMLYKHNYIPYIVPMALQNVTLSNSQYIFASDFYAGNAIDANRTSGDVIVSSGIEYEVEASGLVTLENGFKVEKGAFFAVYPSCF